MAWLRLDEDVLDDPLVAAAVNEQGPLGGLAWIFALTNAKRQNKGGRVKLSAIVLARSCGVTIEQAASVIGTMVTAGLVGLTDDANTYVIPNWSVYQPDPRPNGDTRKSQGLPGTSRDKSDNGTGRDVTGLDGSFLKAI